MKLSVQTGAELDVKTWKAVTAKLLDLVGAHYSIRDRKAIEHFIHLGGRAWPDLEQRARADNPDAAGAIPK